MSRASTPPTEPQNRSRSAERAVRSRVHRNRWARLCAGFTDTSNCRFSSNRFAGHATSPVGWYGVLRDSRGCSSMVEPQPSKLVMRVRFPSPAPLSPAGQSPWLVSVARWTTWLTHSLPLPSSTTPEHCSSGRTESRVDLRAALVRHNESLYATKAAEPWKFSGA